MRRHLLPLLFAALLLPAAAAAEPIEVTAVGKQLNNENPGQESVGRLRWLGTLELSSDDPRFGGYSGLLLGPDGRDLLAVSDTGHWLKGRLDHDAEGRLAGVRDVERLPMLDTAGQPLLGKTEGGDAEGLARDAAGRILVSFERDHRVLAYESLESAGVEIPGDFGLAAGSNEGLEGLAAIPPDGHILALVEGTTEAPGRGFLRQGGRWRELGYRRTRAPLPVGATASEDGTVFLVERSWSLIAGLEIHIVRLPAASVAPGAELKPEELAVLKPPLLIDNFEGIAARTAENGETLLYLLSDDNLNPPQRTLLTLFAVEPE